MTKIKLCGLTGERDVFAANEILPEYVGFVFAEGSRRFVSSETAARFRDILDDRITSVGVFRDASPEYAASLCRDGIIGAVQLHGKEDEEYIERLRSLTDRPVIKAFRICTKDDVRAAAASTADFVLLDSGDGGTGSVFDWNIVRGFERDYFLAGGLTPDNVSDAVRLLKPYAVDVSSGIEETGVKSPEKMREFAQRVRRIFPDA